MTSVTSVAARSDLVTKARSGPIPRRTHGLVVTGSLRAESRTRALGEALVVDQPWLRLGPSLDRLPFYDADLDVPDTVADLRDRVRASALLVVVTPDYDGAVPGLVGNAVDWLTRLGALRGIPFVVVSPAGTTAGAALSDRLARAGGIALSPPVSVTDIDSGVVPAELANLAGRARAAARSRARAEANAEIAPRARARRAA